MPHIPKFRHLAGRGVRIETVAEEYVCAVGVQPGSEEESPEEALCKLKLGPMPGDPQWSWPSMTGWVGGAEK